LVLRTDVSGNPSFAELAGRVRETALAAYAHQDVPHGRLVEILDPPRWQAWHPLYDVMLGLNNAERAVLDLPGLRVTAEVTPLVVNRNYVPLNLLMNPRYGPGGAAEGLAGSLYYAMDLFDEPTAAAIVAGLVHVLEQVAADAAVRVGELEVLSAGSGGRPRGARGRRRQP
jgi:non-ribosomal peptide synthetase component F